MPSEKQIQENSESKIEINSGLTSIIYADLNLQLAYQKYQPDYEQFYEKEVQILRRVESIPNVIKLYRENQSEKHLEFKLYEHKTLFEFCQVKKDKKELQIIRPMLLKLAQSFEILHKDHKIAHRDIKCENILIDEEFNPVIADFGLSTTYEDFQNDRRPAGTEFYKAPEYYDCSMDQIDLEKADVFSFGVLFFILHYNSMPFQRATHKDRDFRQIKYGFFEDFIKSFSPLGFHMEKTQVALLKKMLEPNQFKRISFSDIIKDEYFSRTIPDNKQASNDQLAYLSQLQNYGVN